MSYKNQDWYDKGCQIIWCEKFVDLCNLIQGNNIVKNKNKKNYIKNFI